MSDLTENVDINAEYYFFVIKKSLVSDAERSNLTAEDRLLIVQKLIDKLIEYQDSIE